MTSSLPRFFKEANSQFLLASRYSLQGAPLGMVLVVVGMGLGYLWMIPLGIWLSLYLMKKVGEDEHFVRSVLRHLIFFRSVRYMVPAHEEPSPKVKVYARDGRLLRLQDWVELQREKHG